MYKFFFLMLFLFHIKLVEASPCEKALYYPNFSDNPAISRSMQKWIKPYLMPLNHPIKKTLDAIFERSRAIENEASFSEAGFITLFNQPNSFIKVAKHPLVKGYLFKVYLDTELREKENRPGWHWLVMRCQGAENVRNLIKRKKLRYFTVPEKWLYPLPPAIQSGQPILLVVEDMNLASKAETEYAWKNKITDKHLDELFCILSHGFSSTYLCENIPFTKSGKFSCIDTEHPKRKLDYSRVKHYLSPKMKAYWNRLVITGGKQS